MNMTVWPTVWGPKGSSAGRGEHHAVRKFKPQTSICGGPQGPPWPWLVVEGAPAASC